MSCNARVLPYKAIDSTKNMMKYLKYVLNDHFLLVMLISLGGFVLYYSEFVKTIDETFYLGTLFGILGCSLTIFLVS